MGLKDLFRRSKTTSNKKPTKTKPTSRSSKPKTTSNKKAPATKPQGRRRSDVRKIYKTTDGYFTQNPTNRKPRHVAVIKQRKDDGALAVCKIHSKEGKDEKRKVQGLTLSPKKHKSLKVDSVVSSNPIVATKDKSGKFKPIFKGDLSSTGDKLTKKEHRHILNNLGGGIEKHKKTSNELLQNWDNHFKK